MKTKIHLLACLLLASLVLVRMSARAQDPAKVAPDKFKVILENDKVRVFDVVLKAGEKTGMHSHPASVLYAMSDVKMKTTTSDGKVTETTFKTGEARWSEAITHDNENVGTTDVHALVIELKGARKKK